MRRQQDALVQGVGEGDLGQVLGAADARAYVAAERIRRAVETFKFIWEGTRIPVTISLGIATVTRGNFNVSKACCWTRRAASVARPRPQ